jgi:hypothetical protein
VLIISYLKTRRKCLLDFLDILLPAKEIYSHKRKAKSGDFGTLWAGECSSKKKKRILVISGILQRGSRCRPDAGNL